MRIADLPIPHLTDRTECDQVALILSVRERRRFVAKPATHKKTKAATQLAGMTKEQLEQLLEALTR